METIQTDIATLKTSKSKLEDMEQGVAKNEINIQTLLDHTEADNFRVRMLSAVLAKQDQTISRMSKQIEFLKAQQRKPNLFISGILEGDEQSKEDRVGKVSGFFHETMEIDQEIQVENALRIGKGNPRTLLVTLKNPGDKALIFQNASNLKGKKNARRRLYFINNDTTNQEKESRKYMQHLIKENEERDENEKLHIKLVKGKLVVNNEVIKQQVRLPEAHEVLQLEDEELAEIMEVRTYKTAKHAERGSEFTTHFQRIKSVNDVQKGLNKNENWFR